MFNAIMQGRLQPPQERKSVATWYYQEAGFPGDRDCAILVSVGLSSGIVYIEDCCYLDTVK